LDAPVFAEPHAVIAGVQPRRRRRPDDDRLHRGLRNSNWTAGEYGSAGELRTLIPYTKIVREMTREGRGGPLRTSRTKRSRLAPKPETRTGGEICNRQGMPAVHESTGRHPPGTHRRQSSGLSLTAAM